MKTILIVGDYPSSADLTAKKPFSDYAGLELDSILKQAGIDKGSCAFLNVLSITAPKNPIKGKKPLDAWINKNKKPRPGEVLLLGKWVAPFLPIELELFKEQLSAFKDCNVIIALGDLPLWVLTGETSVEKWRGSELPCTLLENKKVIPTYHPRDLAKAYKNRFPTVFDFKRAKRESFYPEIKKPYWTFYTGMQATFYKNYLQASIDMLDKKEMKIVCDLEIKHTIITCLGLATDKNSAICIPFYEKGLPYFSPVDNLLIINLLRTLFHHPNCLLVNQNLPFDVQFLFWEFLIFPHMHYDTMVAHHVLLPDTLKALDFQASIYNEHYRYWKDDGKFWIDPTVTDKDLWTYNCEDCVRTFECMEEQDKIFLATPDLSYALKFQHKTINNILRIMLTGVNVDLVELSRLRNELMPLLSFLESYFHFIAQEPVDIASPQKLSAYFYDTLKIPPVIKWQTGARSTDDEALTYISEKYPIVSHICYIISLYRSYQKCFTVLDAKLDIDLKWRCSYLVPGTNTYRLSSSKNPYGVGTNLQNITSGKFSI